MFSKAGAQEVSGLLSRIKEIVIDIEEKLCYNQKSLIHYHITTLP